MSNTMTDAELIDYCDSHCETPVGAIHKDMIFRLADLSGFARPTDALEFYHFHEDTVKTMCKAARANLAVKKAEQSEIIAASTDGPDFTHSKQRLSAKPLDKLGCQLIMTRYSDKKPDLGNYLFVATKYGADQLQQSSLESGYYYEDQNYKRQFDIGIAGHAPYQLSEIHYWCYAKDVVMIELGIDKVKSE